MGPKHTYLGYMMPKLISFQWTEVHLTVTVSRGWAEASSLRPRRGLNVRVRGPKSRTLPLYHASAERRGGRGGLHTTHKRVWRGGHTQKDTRRRQVAWWPWTRKTRRVVLSEETYLFTSNYDLVNVSIYFTYFRCEILQIITMERLIHWGEKADEEYSKLLFDKNKYHFACTWIEWSIHGFPWFVVATLALIVAYGKNFDESTQYQLVVLNIGLYFDLIFVAILKFYIHRDRPQKTYSRYLEHTVDIYSFPSGHASRATMLIVMFYNWAPNFTFPFIPLPLIVGLSRVALGRHFITDVLAGIAFGFLEGRLMLTIPYGINTVFRNILK
uniref:AcidPPc domain-containing protein n=1 Tax=Caenorhabditis tropicalis TaxID=1561998 RepID=A0A1I7TJB4_9PELO